MHSNDIIILIQRSTSDPSQFLHMPTDTQQQPEMNTQSSNVRPCFARDPEDGQMALIVKFNELAFVNCSDTKLSLDSRDQRRSLEQSTSKRF